MSSPLTASLVRMALLLALAATGGCVTKVSQCNKLTDAVKRHTTALSTAIAKLGEIQSNPAVAEEFSATIAAAHADIAALEFEDERVGDFAKQYLELLGEADRVNQAMAAAAKATDRAGLDAAAEQAKGVVTLEESIVKGVNDYCQG